MSHNPRRPIAEARPESVWNRVYAVFAHKVAEGVGLENRLAALVVVGLLPPRLDFYHDLYHVHPAAYG